MAFIRANNSWHLCETSPLLRREYTLWIVLIYIFFLSSLERLQGLLIMTTKSTGIERIKENSTQTNIGGSQFYVSTNTMQHVCLFFLPLLLTFYIMISEGNHVTSRHAFIFIFNQKPQSFLQNHETLFNIFLVTVQPAHF